MRCDFRPVPLALLMAPSRQMQCICFSAELCRVPCSELTDAENIRGRLLQQVTGQRGAMAATGRAAGAVSPLSNITALLRTLASLAWLPFSSDNPSS